MCRATSAARWRPVTDEVAHQSVNTQAAEWGENSAKGDSLLNDSPLRNFCNEGSKFKRDSRKGKRGKTTDKEKSTKREKRGEKRKEKNPIS